MSRAIVFTCDGPYDRTLDAVTGTCGAQASVGWDDPAPTGWVYTMMGADLCDWCAR